MIASYGPLFTKPHRRVLLFWALLAALSLAAGIVTAPQPVTFWMFANVCLAFLAPYLAARAYRPYAPFNIVLLLVLMFLTWGAVRTLLQFSLVAVTLAMGALTLADRRPLVSGLLLGLALIEPRVALPVCCWAMFTRRIRSVVAAVSVVAAGVALYCLWVHAGPISVLGPNVRTLLADVSRVDPIAGSIAAAVFAAICVMGFQEGRLRKLEVYAAPPLVACWSLLTLYHVAYGFVVLLPVLMMLALNDAGRSSLRKGLFWLLQIGAMLDMTAFVLRAAWILFLFAGLVVLAWQESKQPNASIA